MSEAGTAMTVDAKWYIVHTALGFEKRVAETVLQRAAALGLEQEVLDVAVPGEQMRGYVLLHARLTDGCVKMIRETPKVTGFAGGNSTPAVLSQDEVAQMLNKSIENGIER